MSHRRIIARLIIVYGSVTRYGPRKLPAREINAEWRVKDASQDASPRRSQIDTCII